jgi:hypothetical protein
MPCGVVGSIREDIFDDAAGETSAPLILFLRNVHPQPWPDVFAVFTVHTLLSCVLRSW